MKNILYMALLCITSIAFSQEQKEVNSKAIRAVSTFGRLGADCNGRGICSFNKTINKAQANTTLIYNKDSTVTFIIDRTKITKEDIYKIIGEPLTAQSKMDELTFVMEDNLKLDNGLKAKLQIAPLLTKIPEGHYPITITKESFTITIKME